MPTIPSKLELALKQNGWDDHIMMGGWPVDLRSSRQEFYSSYLETPDLEPMVQCT